MLHAVLIGVDAYSDPGISGPYSRFARADAAAMATLLNEVHGGAAELTLLVDEEATKARVAHAIAEDLASRVKADDTVLLYFAGQGCPELAYPSAEPSLHLVVHDTRYAELFSTGVNLVSELSVWMRRLPAKVVAVVLDASFNGVRGGRSFEGPGLWSGPRVRRLHRISLDRLAVGQRCAILAASGGKEPAREDEAAGHGVFTHHLLSTVKEAHRRGETLTLSDVHARVAPAVRAATEGEQNPTLLGRLDLEPVLGWGSAPSGSPSGGVGFPRMSTPVEKPVHSSGRGGPFAFWNRLYRL